MDYFTSDLHFGHTNIIKWCNRPWIDVPSMNEGLIYNWNNTVSPKDTVFVVGDVFFCSQAEALSILDRLNGTKILIYGNHDGMIRKNKKLQDKFLKAVDYYDYRTKIGSSKKQAILSHYPMLSWDRMRYGSYMFHGHSHGTCEYPWAEPQNIIDVGVDALQTYAPVTFEYLIQQIETRKISQTPI